MRLRAKYRSLVTTAVLNTKIIEVESKIPDDDKYITTFEFISKNSETLAPILK